MGEEGEAVEGRADAMRILVIASSLGRGGAERAAATVAGGLQDRHSVSIMTFHSLSSYPWSGQRIDLGLPWNPVPSPVTKVRRLYVKLRAVRAAVRREAPDVVLSFSEGPSLIALFARAKVRHKRVPVVVVAQVRPLAQHHGLYRYLYLAIGRIGYRRASSIVSLSQGVADDLARVYGLDRGTITVISNPVDTKLVADRATEPVADSLPAPSDVPVLLTVGRLVAQKNHALLLRAFALVRREVEAKLMIVGTGRLEDDLERLAQELGIRSDVLFLGWVDNPFPLMRRSTVFVLTSDYEGLGNVILEACACGCPVVSTDCPFGPAEILNGSGAGILVPVRDEDALAHAILRVLHDPQLQTELAARGRRRARDFEASLVVGQYERALEATLSR